MRNLICLSNNNGLLPKSQVEYEIRENSLKIKFIVQTETNFSDSKFSHDYRKNWGLWDFDVVECFLQSRSSDVSRNSEYLEFQVSRLGQTFGLKIIKPREIYYTPLNLAIESTVSSGPESWETQIEIPFECLQHIEGNKVFGNFHVCLGDKSNRDYFSLWPNTDKAIDFHRPDTFQELINEEVSG